MLHRTANWNGIVCGGGGGDSGVEDSGMGMKTVAVGVGV